MGGNEEAVRVGEYDLAARCEGRKMPAPGTDVVKYRILYVVSNHETRSNENMFVPIDIAVILSSVGVFRAQFYTSKHALLAIYRT